MGIKETGEVVMTGAICTCHFAPKLQCSVHGKTQLIAKELEASKLRYTAAKLAAKADAPVLVQEICQRMSLRDLAKRVGKSPTYISQIATGKIECSDETYLAMSEV